MARALHGELRGNRVLRERLGARAGNGLRENRNPYREDRPELLSAVRFGWRRSGPPGCCRRQDRHPRRPRRHLHGRYPICAAHRQSGGRDSKDQPRANPFPDQYAYPYRPHRRQRELRKDGSHALRARGTARGNAASPDAGQWQPVPGHGTLINRTDLLPYRDMMLAIQAKVQQMIAQGKTQQEVLAAKVTAPFDAKVPGGLLPAGAGTSADRFVAMVYSELKRSGN